MKKLLLILITAVVGLVAHADKTIYYDNTSSGWDKVNIHWWNNSGDSGDKEMTLVSGNVFKTTELPDKATNMVFNNGTWNNKNQTVEFGEGKTVAIQADHLYYGSGGNDNAQHSIKDEGTPSTYTIYFYADDENAMDVYCHIWGSRNLTTWGSLPKMVDTGKYVKIGNTYRKAYSYTFVAAINPASILFKKSAGDGDKYTDNCTFSNGKFYKNANGGQCDPETQTLVDKGGDDPVSSEYTVYFYDQKNLGSVKTHIWGTNTLHPYKDAQEDMTPMNKYVYIGGNYYPVYKYTFKWDKVPSGLMFYKTGDNDKQTGDCRFVNNAFYTNGKNVGVTGLRIVDRRDDVVTIYFHVKEDIKKYADGNAPYCRVFSGAWNNDDYIKKAEGTQMRLVDENYQIYGYDVKKSDLGNFDNVWFAYFNNKGDRTGYYVANRAPKYDKANWYKYIYTVHDGNYAPQAYLSYDEFTAEIAKGYQNLYVTGGVTDDKKYDDMTMKADDGTASMKALSWKPENAIKVSPDTEGDPVFFLQLHPNFDDCKVTAFKLSWIDTKSFKTKNGGDYKDDSRDWATYDLGIIGVDDETAANHSDWDISVDAGAKQCFFKYNKANPLLEYNQFDWTITSGNMSGSGVSEYYCVVDMHPECRTVTLCTFNPQPKVDVTPGNVSPATLSSQQAIGLHNELNALRGSDVNGHVMFEKVNIVSGSVEVTGAQGVTQTVIDNAKFKRIFTIALDGNKLFDVKEPATYNVDFLPLDGSTDFTVSTLYKSDVTQLTFHSRTGKGTVDVPADFKAPSVEAVDNAEYVYSESTNKMRAYAKLNVTHQGSGYNIYTDFATNDNSTGKGHTSAVAHKDDEYFTQSSSMPSYSWTPCTDPQAWNAGEHDWSSKCVESFNNNTNVIPLFINEALTETELPADYKTNKTLPQKAFKVSLDVVYPILYSSKPTVSRVTSLDTSVKTLAARSSQIPDDLSDFGLSFYRTTGTAVVSTKSDVTGVDEILGDAEADNANAEYYTISGVRVNGDLAPGIYVVRRGNKVTKEVVK